MARPRIFISSTYYDLKHIRNSLENFIYNLGFEAVLFESGDIPFHHDTPLDESCYAEIRNCHIFVLIIGGRYGSPSSSERNKELEIANLKKYNSITKKEYESARSKDIPIYIFIEKAVHSEYQTFKKNRENESISYAHVDSTQIFNLIDEIYLQPLNNQIKEFEKFEDISCWLKDQWAGLFADFLSKKSSDIKIRDMSTQISDLKQLNDTLIKYTESIMKKVQVENAKSIITSEETKIKSSKARRFTREPMIRYLIERYTLKTTPTRLFDLFGSSHTTEEFMKKCRISRENIEEFMTSFESESNKDFLEIKNRYFNDEPN